MTFKQEYYKYDDLTGDFVLIDEQARKKAFERVQNHKCDKLAVKAEKLNHHSEPERLARERAIAEAEMQGKPLSKQEVLELHKREDLARLALNRALHGRC